MGNSNLRRGHDGWIPTMPQVKAAMEAWNNAEPKTQVSGPSWVATFSEVLVAAHNAGADGEG